MTCEIRDAGAIPAASSFSAIPTLGDATGQNPPNSVDSAIGPLRVTTPARAPSLNSKAHAALVPHSAGPAQRRRGLALVGAVTRITGLDGETRQKRETALKAGES